MTCACAKNIAHPKIIDQHTSYVTNNKIDAVTGVQGYRCTGEPVVKHTGFGPGCHGFNSQSGYSRFYMYAEGATGICCFTQPDGLIYSIRLLVLQ